MTTIQLWSNPQILKVNSFDYLLQSLIFNDLTISDMGFSFLNDKDEEVRDG